MSDQGNMRDDPVSMPDEVLAPDQAQTVASAEVVPPATTAEQTLTPAVAAAEAERQQAKAAAFTAYVWNSLNPAAYQTALADADVAYQAAINMARDTQT